MKTRRAKIYLLLGTLFTALASLMYLDLLWFHLTMEGHTLPVFWGILPASRLVESVPFCWPFAVAGSLYRWPAPSSVRSGLCWTCVAAAAGGLLEFIVCPIQFGNAGPIPLYQYLVVYLPRIFPLAYALLGFLTATLLVSRPNARASAD